MSGEVERRLSELGLEIPAAAAPRGNYVPFVRSGDLVFVAGQIPLVDGAILHPGIVGEDVDLAGAQAAARACAVNILGQLKTALDGDLDRVRQVVKLGGFVACTAAFADHPKVINAASDLMVEVFGDRGRHARFAVGASSLPLGSPVEIDAVVEVDS